jgi:Domain of unknown function (DUF4407)
MDEGSMMAKSAPHSSIPYEAQRLTAPMHPAYAYWLERVTAGSDRGPTRSDASLPALRSPASMLSVPGSRDFGAVMLALGVLGGARRRLLPYLSSRDLRAFCLLGLQVVVNGLFVGVAVAAFLMQLDAAWFSILGGVAAGAVSIGIESLRLGMIANGGDEPPMRANGRKEVAAHYFAFLFLLLRLLVSLASALIIATVLMLGVFSADIDAVVRQDRASYAEIAAAAAVAPYEESARSIESEINTTQAAVDRLSEQMAAELSGGNVGGLPGEGPRYLALKASHDYQVSRLLGLRAQLDSTVYEMSQAKLRSISVVSQSPPTILEKLTALQQAKQHSQLYIVWGLSTCLLALLQFAPTLNAQRIGKNFRESYGQLENIDQRMSALRLQVDSLESEDQGTMAQVIDLRERLEAERRDRLGRTKGAGLAPSGS